MKICATALILCLFFYYLCSRFMYQLAMKHTVDKNAVIGYCAGIITGITYGLNPLFGIPLMNNGTPVDSILFFRYGISVVLLGIFILATRQSFKVSGRQLAILLILGVLYTMSSICLFEAYKYIASGLATTLIFLYPVIVALIMILLRVFPTWQVWTAIVATFAGVVILTKSDATETIRPLGVILSLGSALAYSIFIVIVNRSKLIQAVSNSLLTFYSLLVGSVIFFLHTLIDGKHLTTGISSASDWLNLLGLAILPTIISTATLALSTRKIGAAKASVLGVFEPVTAILVGTLAFGEALTANIVIGISVCIAAVVFMIVSSKNNSQ